MKKNYGKWHYITLQVKPEKGEMFDATFKVMAQSECEAGHKAKAAAEAQKLRTIRFRQCLVK